MWRSAVQVCLGLHRRSQCAQGRSQCDNGPQYGGLAQLARAPALQAGGQRFESVILHVSVGGIEVRHQEEDL